jgi:hypothetical protein
MNRSMQSLLRHRRVVAMVGLAGLVRGPRLTPASG